jgi:Bacterial TSP3 repeat
MPIGGRLRLRSLAAVAATAVVAQLGIFGGTANAADTPLWKVEVAKIPATEYTRDAKVYVTEATEALRPYVGDGLGDSRLEPVQADVASRYFDGARFNGTDDAEVAFDNLAHLESFLKGRLTGASPPNGEAEQAHVTALVKSLTGVRLLADAAIQDAEATIGPFRASPPPAPPPDGITEAFADLDAAKVELAKTDDMLAKANPEPATVHAAMAWESGFNVLTRLGITYEGDHDGDGVVDVVELRFGASPLLEDSDGDGLTDKTEILQLAGWTVPNNPDSDGDGVPDGEEDIDGDGLTNLQEQDLGTSLTEADTDGDGLSDGAEVARGTNPLVPDQPEPDPISGDTPPIVPAPTDVDTDGDGMGDIAEGEVGTDPANVDTDGDGLSDGEEALVLGISPLKADTDGDGLGDGYEVAHTEDQGLDPAIADERVSKWTYVTDFLLGLTAGDFAPRDSMAWLGGYICSGGLSLIPVVGWILGGLADLRDTIAAIIHGDWVGAGLSIIGLVPYAGDAVAIPGKVAKFVFRYLHRFDRVLRLVARYDKISDSVKTLAFKAIMLGDYGKLTNLGLSDAVILRLGRSTRMSFKALTEALSAANHVPSSIRAPFMRNFNEGEDWLENTMQGLGRPGTRPPANRIDTPGNPDPNSYRLPDYLEQTPGGDVIHEVKSGTPYFEESALKQCKQDAALRTAGQVAGVHWHFVPHANGTLGPPKSLLDCLVGNNIPFTIYAPL